MEWLKKRVAEHDIDRLVIFATPRILGLLRKAPSGLLQGHLEEIEGNLMRLQTGELAEHQMVRGLVLAPNRP